MLNLRHAHHQSVASDALPRVASELIRHPNLVLHGYQPNAGEWLMLRRILKLGCGITRDENGWRIWGLDDPHKDLTSAYMEFIALT